MPERWYIGVGAASGFLVLAGLFLSGVHHEIRWRIRQRRRGGYLL